MYHIPELFDGVSTEAREPGVQHETHERHDLLLIRSYSQVALYTQVQKPSVEGEKQRIIILIYPYQ